MICVDTEGAFRIIQSIPSRRRSLSNYGFAKARVRTCPGNRGPELAQKRMKEIYRAKGYSEDWIEKRVRGYCNPRTSSLTNGKIAGRGKHRILDSDGGDIQSHVRPDAYAIQAIKMPGKRDLRDHMTDLELIFQCWANGDN